MTSEIIVIFVCVCFVKQAGFHHDISHESPMMVEWPDCIGI